MIAKLNKIGKNSRNQNLCLRTFESSVFQISTKSAFLGAFLRCSNIFYKSNGCDLILKESLRNESSNTVI